MLLRPESGDRRMFRMLHRNVGVASLAIVLTCLDAARSAAQATNTLPADLAAKVAAAVTDVINKTHVPSASVGIVQNGRVTYIAAFGHPQRAHRAAAELHRLVLP